MPRRRQWKRAVPPPQKRGTGNFVQVWRIVDGAVADAIRAHPEYFRTNQNRADARRSIVKRVTGSIMGYLAEARRGVSGK
jgi:hypothetical protein